MLPIRAVDSSFFAGNEIIVSTSPGLVWTSVIFSPLQSVNHIEINEC